METATRQIAEALLGAIHLERDERHFYEMASMNTTDPKGKEIFQTLAEEEHEHQNFLKKQYESVMKSGCIDRNIKLSRKSILDEENIIFSEDIKNRIGKAHHEMSALSIAIKLELNSMNFYKNEAGQADDPAVKEFYEILEEWEKKHYEALLAQEDDLRKDYWEENGFYPF